MPELIHVAAAALVDAQGRVLIAQRHASAHQGGLWEFPGGKCEPGETFEQALARELDEELGVKLLSHRPLIRITHHYDDRSVLLDVHRVDRWQGEPHGRENQPLQWVLPAQLTDYPMPAADVPIVSALQLPDRYLITPPALTDTGAFFRQLQSALQQTGSLVQLRVFDLDANDLEALAIESQKLCEMHGGRLLINGDVGLAQRVGATGVHLNSRQLHSLQARPQEIGLLAVSCHNADDLRKAACIGADLAVLSPVLPTRSHPDASPLGWQRFAELVEPAGLPVYALGGMQAALLPRAWQAGAQGIAGIRGLWPA